jgi:peptidoglycan hydrolase-like amidase
MYRYLNRHAIDRYNLCDDTHCQVYMGNSLNPLINKAVIETAGQVVLGRDSLPIMSAFILTAEVRPNLQKMYGSRPALP